MSSYENTFADDLEKCVNRLRNNPKDFNEILYVLIGVIYRMKAYAPFPNWFYINE